jgi:hypothetical protein
VAGSVKTDDAEGESTIMDGSFGRSVWNGFVGEGVRDRFLLSVGGVTVTVI